MKINFLKIVSSLTLTAGLIAVSGIVSAATFVPSSGRLLVIGQDTSGIGEYTNNFAVPGGVAVYTSLDTLGGLTSNVDNGAGANNAMTLTNNYPQSALQVAIYAVDHLDYINGTSSDTAKNTTFNNNIDTMITTLKNFNRPVYLRFGYEFDGAWNHYDPAKYKLAYKKIYDRIGTLNARNNISMVWHSSSYCYGTYNNLTIDNWYPGDAYVDMVGISYFLSNACNHSAVNNVYSFAQTHGKKVMIAEAAAQGFSISQLTKRTTDGTVNVPAPVPAATTTEIWAWFSTFFAWIDAHPDVKVVTYISGNWNAQWMWGTNNLTGTLGYGVGKYTNGYWGDTRVTANGTIASNWYTAVGGPTTGYLKASSTLFTTLGYGTTPPPSPTKKEGELGTLASGAAQYTDAAASGGKGVANLSTVNASVTFTGVPASTSFDVRYASALAGTMTYYVNNVKIGTFSFTSTGVWTGTYATKNVVRTIPANATVKISFQTGDKALNLDYVTFKP